MSYSGADNLAIMAYAHNYNEYLAGLVIKRVPDLSGVRILDFGCGRGEMLKRVERKTSGEVHGFEVDKTFVDELTRCDMTVFSRFEQIDDEQYDYIYSLNVIEHVENDLAAVKQLNRILKPDGRIFIYVPAFMFLFTHMDKKVGHYRRYTYRTLRKLFDQAGFSIGEWKYADFVGVPTTLAYKLLDKSHGEIATSALKFYDSWLFPMNRIFDTFAGKLLGKNIWIVAHKK